MSDDLGLKVDGDFAFPALEVENLDLSRPEILAGVVKQLVDKSHVGILTTIDEVNRPQTRWMASISADEFPWFYSLTAESSRKIAQIEKRPEVNWMFCNADLSMVVNFSGRAKIVREIEEVKRVWKLVHNKEHAYFLRHSVAGLGFVVIATRIEAVECCTPKTVKRYVLPGEVF